MWGGGEGGLGISPGESLQGLALGFLPRSLCPLCRLLSLKEGYEASCPGQAAGEGEMGAGWDGGGCPITLPWGVF